MAGKMSKNFIHNTVQTFSNPFTDLRYAIKCNLFCV